MSIDLGDKESILAYLNEGNAAFATNPEGMHQLAEKTRQLRVLARVVKVVVDIREEPIDDHLKGISWKIIESVECVECDTRIPAGQNVVEVLMLVGVPADYEDGKGFQALTTLVGYKHPQCPKDKNYGFGLISGM